MSEAGRDQLLDVIARLGPALLTALHGLEVAKRRMHPPQFDAMRERLAPVRTSLDEAITEFSAVDVPEQMQPFHQQLGQSAEAAQTALRLFIDPSTPAEMAPRVLGAMHQHCKAQALLYPLRKIMSPVSRYFVEEPFHDRLAQLDPDDIPEGARVGIHRARGQIDDRGGFCLYVPESWDGEESLPLVVALHGGSGTGLDFLWSWLTEARGRRFLLLAPTALGQTWSMTGPDVDGPALRSMVGYVKEHWSVDDDHVLLTGLSDGATYGLLTGLAEDSPFTHIAPACGVFHPANAMNGNLDRAAGRPIYLIHGTLDWMFPVEMARMAHEKLASAGAAIVFREIEDLSHTYPRDENDRILTWFDERLALPTGGVE